MPDIVEAPVSAAALQLDGRRGERAASYSPGWPLDLRL